MGALTRHRATVYRGRCQTLRAPVVDGIVPEDTVVRDTGQGDGQREGDGHRCGQVTHVQCGTCMHAYTEDNQISFLVEKRRPLITTISGGLEREDYLQEHRLCKKQPHKSNINF